MLTSNAGLGLGTHQYMTGPLPTSPPFSSRHRLGLTFALAPELLALLFFVSTPSDSDPLDSAFLLEAPFLGAIA